MNSRLPTTLTLLNTELKDTSCTSVLLVRRQAVAEVGVFSIIWALCRHLTPSILLILGTSDVLSGFNHLEITNFNHIAKLKPQMFSTIV